ncbi:MAG: hypothetical protein R3E01_11765 [Pirellulaceae bacterium]|nr:DUF11 domain-containing protein [Planctomycetales bacterium]
MKRSANRLMARFVLLCLAVIFGAIAVAQAQRSFQSAKTAEEDVAAEPDRVDGQVQPIPLAGSDSIPTSGDASWGTGGNRAYGSAADSATVSPQFDDQNAGSYAANYEEPAPTTPAPAAPSIKTVANEVDDTGYAPMASRYSDSATEVDDYASAPVAPAASAGYDYGDASQYESGYSAAQYEPSDYSAAPTYDEPEGQAAMLAPPTTAQLRMDPQSTDSQYSAAAETPAEMPELEEPTAPATESPAPLDNYTDNYAQPTGPSGFGQPSYDTLPPRSDNAGAARLQIREDEVQPIEAPPADNPMPDNRFPRAAAQRESIGQGMQIADEGAGKPGPAELEGPQTPSLTVEKLAPQEIQVGKSATFTIKVRNIGRIAAHEVILRDVVPQGTRLVNTVPPANMSADGELLWELGTVKPGAEVTAQLNLMPLTEGEVGSIATVSFQASASARTRVTRPVLSLEHTTAQQVLIGNDVIFSIKLTNTGTGVAEHVKLEENVPEGLRHSAGNELEYEIGNLQPGETRHLELTLKADKPGMVDNLLLASADANVSVEDRCQLQVVAPQLQVGIDGPHRRYLERQATYELMVANQGTAAAQDVELVAHLPRGLKFVSTTNAGYYDQQKHAVLWSLAELPAEKMGTVQLVTTPTEVGEHKIRFEGKARMNLSDAVEHPVTVEGLAALLFTVTDTDPIEVGGKSTYEIKIVNQGTKTATNVQVLGQVPAGMKAVNGDGPTRVTIDGNRVYFEPLARLAPQSDTTYRIHVEGLEAGDQRFRVLVKSDELSEPVTKEESTHVYSDQ